jgi:type III secretion system FlhB-like substrate exporter
MEPWFLELPKADLHCHLDGSLRIQTLVALAKEQGIPVREDADLAQSLAQLDLGDLIPAELYPAVAEVLAFIYRQNKRRELPER